VTLVEIRCRVCRKLLDDVVSAPAPGDEDHWASLVRVQICQRHGEGGGHGNILAWQARQRRAGKPADRRQTHNWIPWADLRPGVEKARRTDRT
jgi:hypothetical protein